MVKVGGVARGKKQIANFRAQKFQRGRSKQVEKRRPWEVAAPQNIKRATGVLKKEPSN